MLTGGPALLSLLLAVLLSSAVCRRDTGSETQAGGPGPVAAPSVPAPPPVDRAFDDRFAFAAGLPVEEQPYLAWREEPGWKDFASLSSKDWTNFDSAVLGPMRRWAGSDLAEVREKTSTLFYPFGGPDFATAFALFPGATTIVLMGLEPIGNLPDFAKASAEWRGEFFADLGRSPRGSSSAVISLRWI